MNPMLTNDEAQCEFSTADLQMLPAGLLEDMGFEAKRSSSQIQDDIPLNNNYFVEKVRTRSTLAPPISIEFPKSRQKSSSLIRFNFLVSSPHGLTPVQAGVHRQLVPKDYVIYSDGPVLRYGVAVHADVNKSSEKEEKRPYMSSDKSIIRFIDEDHILVPSLIDRDKKALILLQLIIERMNVEYRVVFLETVSFNHRAAFHLGHKYTNQNIVKEICKQLQFLFGCPIYPFYIEDE
ncbi:hypothetical protein GPJ56_010885 [Histomonas meleagridis]|uniref:uncharacterized protein n=1 Tax=Histomonas meleagridis TaxID=135588 RepID=UPI0035596509|nr:hypothetical protein GPJ56_010885 [Histomonas meleagridis]KAH0803693.1 hypothetical protein GO595_003467 [Histomonas meleagridis]